jgi:hypothetical protein
MKTTTLTLAEVKVKAGGEDPAYEIIRNAIKQRKFYQTQVGGYTCEAYLKGLIRTANFPDNFMGQPVDFEDGDSSKNKIIFLSESISDIAFRQPDELRVLVKSTRVSGQTNGLGLANPILISFYDNIVSLPKTFNPRGFVSPIADGALAYYRYKYLGVFFENGYQVNKIQVIPKRKWEPLFTGYIQIIEKSWNIHSVNLSIDKESQLEFADKIRIEQQYNPINRDTWMVSTQTIFPEINFFDTPSHFNSYIDRYDLALTRTSSIANDLIINGIPTACLLFSELDKQIRINYLNLSNMNIITSQDQLNNFFSDAEKFINDFAKFRTNYLNELGLTKGVKDFVEQVYLDYNFS